PAPASSPRSASWRTPAGSSFAAMLEEASLSRVMREPAFGASPRLVAFGAERGLPAAVQALGAAAAAEGHDRGRREGVEEGTAAAARQVAALAGLVAEAIDGGIEQLRRLRVDERAELLELAAAIARAVTGGERSAGGNRLLADVAAALEALDDAQLVVAVNSRDLQLLMGGLWMERHALELLAYKLTCAKLIMAGDIRRYVATALAGVEHAVDRVRVAELDRSIALAQVAEDWDVPTSTLTLDYLAEHAP